MGMAAFIKWEKPSLFLLGFILVNAYVPGIFGAAIPTAWLFLIIVSVPLMFLVETRITNSHILGLLFVLYSLVSLAWTQNLNIAAFFVMQMLALSCVFCFCSAIQDIRPVLMGLTVGLITSNIMSATQYFYNSTFIYTLPGMPAGLFINQNIFCEVSAILFLSLVIFRLWIFIPFTLPGLLLIHSRGAVLAVIVGMIYWLYRINKNAAYIVSAICIISGVLLLPHFYELTSTTERVDLYLDSLNGFSFFGQGIGSFEIIYPLYATHIDTFIARPRFAHNDLIQLVYEFGIGSILFVLMISNIMRIKSDAKIILCGAMVLSTFNYSMHVPVIAFITFMVAGFVTRFDATIWNYGDIWRPNLFKSFKRERNIIL